MNRRILVIDDQQAIREDFWMILAPSQPNGQMDALDAALQASGLAANRKLAGEIRYDLAFAGSGEEGVRLLRESIEAERPFALAFVDVRMTPGMDGVETVAQIRKLDPWAEIVVMTAYSDRDRSDLLEACGDPSRLLYLRKPFSADEIEQIAHSLTEKWNLSARNRRHRQALERALASVAQMEEARRRGVETLSALFLEGLADLACTRDLFLILGGRIACRLGDAPQPGKLTEILGADALKPQTIVRDDELSVIGFPFEEPSAAGVAIAGEAGLGEFADLTEMYVRTGGAVLRGAMLQEKVMADERRSALGDAAAWLVHDLRNRLSLVVGLASLIADPGAASSERVEYAGTVASSAREMLAYLQDLLTFARGKTDLERELADVSALVEEMVAEYASAKRSLALRCKAAPGLKAWVDERKFRRAFRNILGNAVEKAAGEGATYCIEVAADRQGDSIVLDIADNGAPLAEAVRARLFDPFASGRKQGTGLGLTIARDFMRQHGGDVALLPSSERGVAFRMTLPLAKKAPGTDSIPTTRVPPR